MRTKTYMYPLLLVLLALLSLVTCGGELYVKRSPAEHNSEEGHVQLPPPYTYTCTSPELARIAEAWLKVTGHTFPCQTYIVSDANRIYCPGVGPCLAYVEGTSASYVVELAYASYPGGGDWTGVDCSALVEAAIFAQYGRYVMEPTRISWEDQIYQELGCQ